MACIIILDGLLSQGDSALGYSQQPYPNQYMLYMVNGKTGLSMEPIICNNEFLTTFRLSKIAAHVGVVIAIWSVAFISNSELTFHQLSHLLLAIRALGIVES